MKEIEHRIQSNPFSLQIKKSDPKLITYTNRYALYCHPEAIPLIKQGDRLLLRQFNEYKIDFTYHYNDDPASGEIIVKGTALNRFECDLWHCNRKFPRLHLFEKVLPPLEEGYILKCGICEEPMEIVEPAPFPLLRDELQALTVYKWNKNHTEVYNHAHQKAVT